MASRFAVLVATSVLLAGTLPVWAREGHMLKLPRRSDLTPVQRLNRDGVKAVTRHDYKAAETLFYKAYLYDPADPFTLNNLGYMAEIDGDFERAQRFYALAAQQGSNATIDLSDAKRLEGQPMRQALVDLNDTPVRVNHVNIQAVQLLAQDRGYEALALLEQVLPLEPNNPFTLNNLGVANEASGDYEAAIKYYRAAAAARSSQEVAISLNKAWRGRSMGEIADGNAKRLAQRMQDLGANDARARMLTIQGVHAANQNDWTAARNAFLRAYTLDPTSAFTTNNRGWVAEREGDLEAAQYFYWKAQSGENASAKVGFATRLTAEGQTLNGIAAQSNNKVDDALDAFSRQRKHEQATPELIPRGVPAAPASAPSTPSNPQ